VSLLNDRGVLLLLLLFIRLSL